MVAPAVSVVIPVYRARYLRAAVDSVLAQTFRDFEIIVVDDGSPDRADPDRWPAPDGDRLQILRQTNQGPSAARNAGIRAARGTFVAFLDSDDTWEAGYLAEQVAAITRGQGLDLVYSNWVTLGEPEASRRAMEAARAYGPVSCTGLLREECEIALSGVVLRREIAVAAGLFDERFRHAEDFDLWLRMLKHGARMDFQRRALLNRRVHVASLSYDPVLHGERALLVLEKFRVRDDLDALERAAVEWRTRSLRAELAVERAKRAVAEGDFPTAIEALRDANEFYRTWKLRLVGVLLRLSPTLIARANDVRRRWRVGRSHATVERQ
jgi:glycosyltransferase involved in cell wall biosynthesis